MKTFIGDAVMTLPLITELQHHFPTRSIISSPEILQLLPPTTQPWNLVPFQKRHGPAALLKQVQELKRHRFDLVILVNRSFRSALIARMAGIPRRIGHLTESRNFLLTDCVPNDSTDFEANAISTLANPLGLVINSPKPKIQITDQEREKGKHLLRGATVGIQPGARFTTRQLPKEAVIHLCNELHLNGHRIAFLGGKAERALSEEIASSLSFEPTNLVGKTELRETLGCLANLQAMVGSDTGLLHLSAASGTPTLQVFAKADPRRWGHQYSPNRVITAPAGQMQNLESCALVEETMRLLGAE